MALARAVVLQGRDAGYGLKAEVHTMSEAEGGRVV
jgi:hypothetical protein